MCFACAVRVVSSSLPVGAGAVERLGEKREANGDGSNALEGSMRSAAEAKDLLCFRAEWSPSLTPPSAWRCICLCVFVQRLCSRLLEATTGRGLERRVVFSDTVLSGVLGMEALPEWLRLHASETGFASVSLSRAVGRPAPGMRLSSGVLALAWKTLDALTKTQGAATQGAGRAARHDLSPWESSPSCSKGAAFREADQFVPIVLSSSDESWCKNVLIPVSSSDESVRAVAGSTPSRQARSSSADAEEAEMAEYGADCHGDDGLADDANKASSGAEGRQKAGRRRAGRRSRHKTLDQDSGPPLACASSIRSKQNSRADCCPALESSEADADWGTSRKRRAPDEQRGGDFKRRARARRGGGRRSRGSEKAFPERPSRQEDAAEMRRESASSRSNAPRERERQTRGGGHRRRGSRNYRRH